MSKILVDSIKPNFGDTITLDGNVEITGDFNFNESNCNNITIVTYNQIQLLIKDCKLCPGRWYKILDFNKNTPIGSVRNPHGYLPSLLYDDSTNAGISVYLMALTTCEMSTRGYGEFWNPNYYQEEDYYNPDYTGVYGIWNGDHPSGANVPIYNKDEVVFWGGYAWKNVQGNVGFKIDNHTLNTDDWIKMTYGSQDLNLRDCYKKVIDEIVVDWNYGLGLIVERFNSSNCIKVSFTPDTYQQNHISLTQNSLLYYFPGNLVLYAPCSTSLCRNPIAAIPWGLYPNLKINRVNFPDVTTIQNGIQNINSTNSYPEFINFKGLRLWNIKIENSAVWNNFFGINSVFDNNEITFYSAFRRNSIYTITDKPGLNAVVSGNKIEQNSSVALNYVVKNASFSLNSVINSSRVWWNSISDNASMSENQIIQGSVINGMIVGKNCTVKQNTLINSSVISDCDMDNRCAIFRNYLTDWSYLGFINFRNSVYVEQNVLENNGVFEKSSFSNNVNIKHNKISNSTILEFFNISNNSNLLHNLIDNNSRIFNSELDSDVEFSYCEIKNNTSFLYLIIKNGASFKHNLFINSPWNFTSSGNFLIPSKSINQLSVNNVTLFPTLANATNIFLDTDKKIYKRLDNAIRLSYFDNNDTAIITNYNA